MDIIYVMPIRAQWIVRCDKHFGLAVQIGSTAPDENADAVTVQIIPYDAAITLSEAKCREIAPIAGNIMSQITYAPRR